MIKRLCFIAAMLHILILSGYEAYAGTPADRGYKADRGDGYYVNPIMCGNYADPSVLRVDDDYYMTHSSFEALPGLEIWHSKDLVNWEPVGHALDKYVGSVWAPDFIRYKDKYYIYFPASGGNYVVTADSPEGPWSDPVDLHVGEIDPGHVVDKDGNRYIHLSGGHVVPLSDDGLKVTGPMKKIYDGWQYPQDWIVECFCLESPKLTYKDGWYYLTSAQGGTGGPPTSHMVVSARSKTPLGPWENSPYNPIERNSDRNSKWASTGHGTLVDTPDGDWWIMFHGYDSGNRTIGRQTLLLPIEWTEDGWFRVPYGYDPEMRLKKPDGEAVTHGISLSDEFTSETLDTFKWKTLKNDDRTRFCTEDGALRIDGRNQEFPAGNLPLVQMPNSSFYQTEALVKAPEGTQGGLVFYVNEDYLAGLSLEDGDIYMLSSRGGKTLLVENAGEEVWLRLVNDHHDFLCYWSRDGQEWERIGVAKELSGWHANAIADWGVLRPGVFGAGDGEVTLRHYRYTPIEY